MTFFELVDKHWDDLMALIRKVLNALKGLVEKDEETTPAE